MCCAPIFPARPKASRSSRRCCFTRARAKMVPRRLSSARTASTASSAVKSTSTLASVFRTNQRACPGPWPAAARARRRKSWAPPAGHGHPGGPPRGRRGGTPRSASGPRRRTQYRSPGLLRQFRTLRVPPPGGRAGPGSLGHVQRKRSAWGGYGPRSLASGTYGTLARGAASPVLTAPPGRDRGAGCRDAGGSTAVIPRTRRRSIRDPRNPSGPSPIAGQPPRSSCMVHAPAKTGRTEPVRHQVRQQPVRGGTRTGPQGGYRTGESSGRGDNGQGGRPPGVARGREPRGYTTFPSSGLT